MSYETSRIIRVRGRTIEVAHLELPEHPSTVLTADVSATGTALTVLDNAGFVNAQKILIGELGKEQTEIKSVNAAVTAGTALTSTAVTFAHPAGALVKRILFNQWRIYGNATNTTVGSTLIATIDVIALLVGFFLGIFYLMNGSPVMPDTRRSISATGSEEGISSLSSPMPG